MPAKAAETATIVVTGDVTIDWGLMRQRAGGSESAWNPKDTARLHWVRGGAAMLGDLVERVGKRLQASAGTAAQLYRCGAPDDLVRPDDERFHHSHAIWSQFDREQGSDAGRGTRAWRVESFLGLDLAAEEAGDWQRVQDDPPSAELVILDDAALGFRSRTAHWPRSLQGSQPRWVLLKMAHEIAKGDLWALLREKHRDRLIVVVPVSDLRLAEVRISRGLSWERTAQDLSWELSNNPRINELSRCAHVVVSLGPAGAFLMSKVSGREAEPRCRLFFDPSSMEGEWAQTRPGGMIGYTTCLTASIARELIAAPGAPEIETGIHRGLAAIRRLHLDGYKVLARAKGVEPLAFPFDAIADEIEAPRGGFSACDVSDPAAVRTAAVGGTSRPAPWTILSQQHDEGLDSLSEQIVLRGAASVLRDVPLQRFGKLVTVDRQEIEAYRSIRSLILEYSSRDDRQPLSIAVFGPPGAGKSFGVREISESLPGIRAQVLTFNLSQLRDRDDLRGAFHQIRDVRLTGRLPVVFWDEFDTSLEGDQFGWLPSFLTPMQDGVFQEGQLTHPIGRAIFVFAGGTSRSMGQFTEKAALPKYAQAKMPDFVSRIRGFVDVMGPDPVGSGPESDPHACVRRAVLLRAILEQRAPQLLQPGSEGPAIAMDLGVLRAFLQVRRFRHGARSLESIVTMSRLQGRDRFERSALPPESQLELHVDAAEFLALVQAPDLKGDLLEKLAAAVHEAFIVRQEGPHPMRMPFPVLPPHEQEQNRDNARDIPRKLATIGYVMTPARDGLYAVAWAKEDVERLAEEEHERWVRVKLANGYRCGPRSDTMHPALVPWSALSAEALAERYTAEERAALGVGPLPETEREKDRGLVRDIPRILQSIGYTIVRARRLETGAGGSDA